MSRVGDILEIVRDTLSDHTETRYDTERLLRSLTQAQNKIAKDALCIRYKCAIDLCDGYHTYKLDSAAVELLGGAPIALFGARNHAGKAIRFVSEAWMDSNKADWSTDTGTDVTHIIYDKQQPLVFRVYPIPDASLLTETGASFNTVNEPIADAATIVQPLGIASNFDITAQLAPIKLLLNFYLKPPSIETVSDTNLLISMHFDEALPHYIAGVALRDDKDSQNRAFGKEELALFDAEYKVAKELAEKDYISQKHEYYAAVTYNKVI